MTKIDLPYIRIAKAKGRLYAYYRRNKQQQRIHGEIGSPEFLNNYNRIHESFSEPDTTNIPADQIRGSFAWLVLDYKRSPRFCDLSPRSKKDYSIYLDELVEKYGRHDFAALTRPAVISIRDRHQDTKRRSKYYLQLISILSEHAIDRGLRSDNPAKGVKHLKGGAGWQAWTDIELQRFEADCQDERMKLAFYLALYTGQRQSDIIKMSWSQIKDNMIEVVQEKTKTPVFIPIHQELRKLINQIPKSNLVLLTSAKGKPFTENGFRNAWQRQRQKLGLEKQFHGLRRNAAKSLAEVGCTEKEIMAITGHKTSDMIRKYTQEASQKKLAKAAILRLEQK